MRRMWWVVDCAFLSPEFVVWWSLHASFSCVIVRFIMPVRCCACCSHLAMFLLMGTASTVVKTSIDVAWGVENSVAHFWSPEPECYTWLFERWYEQKICSPANGGDISIWWSIRWLGLALTAGVDSVSTASPLIFCSLLVLLEDSCQPVASSLKLVTSSGWHCHRAALSSPCSNLKPIFCCSAAVACTGQAGDVWECTEGP